MEDFHEILEKFEQENDFRNANEFLMAQLGGILVKDRANFINLLNESGIHADENMDERQLMSLFIENININKQLILGTSLLINSHNKTTNFDGEEEMNDDSVRSSFSAIETYYGADEQQTAGSAGANVLGKAASGGVVGAIAGALGEGAKLGNTIAINRGKKQNAISDMLAKKEESKNAMVQGIIAQKSKMAEAKLKAQEFASKNKKTILIVGGVVLGLTILGVAIYYIKKKK